MPNTRVRISVALLVLAAYAALCFSLAILWGTGLETFLCSLGAIYGVSAVSLGAKFFWARWYARGVAYWGVSTSALLMFLSGVGWILVAICASHAVVLLMIAGKDVSDRYEGQSGWQDRLHPRLHPMIGDVFVNLGSLLPYLAYYAWFPRQASVLGPLLVVTLGVAMVGLHRFRTWGLLLLNAVSTTLLVSSLVSADYFGAVVGGALLLGSLRFVPLIVQFLRAPSADRTY